MCAKTAHTPPVRKEMTYRSLNTSIPNLKTMSLPPLEELEQVLAYDPETGLFTVLKPFGRKNWVRKAGDIFGKPSWPGLYTQVSLWGKTFYPHRIAWLLYHKRPPREGYGISHLNGDKSDNRIANLVETPIKRTRVRRLTRA
jgi:HNH endonuclease